MTRVRHACAQERGWTLFETLLGLVLGLAISSAALMILQSALHAQKEAGSRLAAQSDGTLAMLRITKDVRAATQAYLVDARTLDLQVPQRSPSGGSPVSTHVRYQCAGGAGAATCSRYECSTPVNSNSCPSPPQTLVLASKVANADNFQGASMGVDISTPANTPPSAAGTGTAAAGNLGFVSIHMQIARSEDAGPDATGKPLDFVDGADLGNFSN